MRVCPSDFVVSRLLGEPKPTSSGMPEVQDPGTSPRLRLLATLHADMSPDPRSTDLCAKEGGRDSPIEESETRTRDEGGGGEDGDGRCSRCKGHLSEGQSSGVRYCRSPSSGDSGSGSSTDKLCSLCQRRACFSPRSQSFAAEPPRRRKVPFWRQLTSTSLLGPVKEGGGEKDSEAAQWGLRAAVAEEDPDFLLLRKSQRFKERRNALCEPERMLISQEVRERLERDVERRKRSLVRRFSMFFTVRLDIHTEEDLF